MGRAMRNKKWHIRRALVADLRTDPLIANSQGRTPPGMQLRESFPRLLLALSCAVLAAVLPRLRPACHVACNWRRVTSQLQPQLILAPPWRAAGASGAELDGTRWPWRLRPVVGDER